MREQSGWGGADRDAAAYCWGQDVGGRLGTGRASPMPAPVLGGLTWAQISAGRLHTCGVTVEGAAYCWGANLRGQLGTGFTDISGMTSGDFVEREPVPVSGGLTFRQVEAALGEHTCGSTTDGRTFCWGYNTRGQLGYGKQEFFGGTLQEMRSAPVEVVVPRLATLP